METLVALLDTLSASVGRSWKDGELCAWILKGIEGSKDSTSGDGFSMSLRVLEKHFPKCFLVEGEDVHRRGLKLSLFSAYFGSVKHGWQPLKRVLLKLKYPEQYLLERIFSHLLEDKWDEDLLSVTSSSSTSSSSSGENSSGGSSTPLSRFKKGTSGSPSSFHYSPSTFHPLKDFFSSPVTTQISKYQRIAEDQKRLLSLIRLELDQEKLETMNLLKERDELSKERLQLKKALTIARQNLLDNEANLQETDDEAAYEELQKRLSEKRDTEKYVNTLEEQLGQSVDQKEELRRTVENQRTKLEERSMSNAELDSKNIQLQVSLNLEKQLNGDLSHKCSELELQVKELQEILDSRRSSSKEQKTRLKRTGKTDGVSVADISIDDPMMSLPSSPEGENMAEALVIPELEEQLTIVSQERDLLQDKINIAQGELSQKIQEASQLQNQLKEATLSNEKLTDALNVLTHEKNRVQESLHQLTNENAQLLETLQKLSQELNASKDNSERLENLNKDLQDLVSSLRDQISEINVSKAQALESLSSQLDSLQASQEESLLKNETLSREIEDFKCKEANYANEALERESKLNSAMEELKNLGSSKEKLQKDLKELSKTMEEKVSEMNSAINTLTNEKNLLTVKQSDLENHNQLLLTERDNLKSSNVESTKEVESLKIQNKELSSDLATSTSAMTEFEEKIQSLQLFVNNLEGDISNYNEKYESSKREVDQLKSLLESNASNSKSQIQGLSDQNELFKSQLQSQKKHSELLESELSTLQEKCQSKEDDFMAQSKRLEDLTSANNGFVKELESLKDTHSSNLVDSERKLTQVSVELNSKTEEVQRLMGVLEQAQETNKNMTQKLKELEEEMHEKNKLVKVLEDETAAVRKNFESQMRTLTEDSTSEKSKLASVETRILDMGKIIADKDKEIESLTSQVKNLSSQEITLTKSIEASERQIVSQEGSLSSLETKLKDLDSQIHHKDVSIEELKFKITSMEEKVSLLVQEKQETETNNEAKLRDLAKISENLQSSNAQLKLKSEELEDLRSNNSNLQSELTSLKSSMETTVNDASQKVEKLNANLLAFDSVKRDLEEEIHTKKSEIIELHGTVDRLKSEIESLHSSLNTKSLENDSLKSKENTTVHDYQSKINELHKDAHKREFESKSEIESLCSQVQELSGELDLKNKALLDLRKDFHDLQSVKAGVESTNKQLTADISKALNAVDKCEKEVTEINYSLSALENENQRLKEELKDLRSTKDISESVLKTQLDELRSRTEFYEKEIQTFKDGIGGAANRDKSFEKKLREELQQLEASLEAKSKNDLAAQKKRYEARVKAITENVASQYKAKIEQFSKEKVSENEKLSQKSQEAYEKYEIAKVKLTEMANKLNEMSKENEALQKKYVGSKSVILQLKGEKEASHSEGSLSMELETLKRQLAKAHTENRTLSVQFSAADQKIRSLQEELSSVHYQENPPLLPSCRESPQRIFKIPQTTCDTPGRTRSGRTQSESHFRRPPNGVGALFNVDDEEGEMFSNSYLSDVKEGRCMVNDSGRLSELSRRNTLQPSHLKSSYPIETQFYDLESFKENEIKEGRMKMESITKGTANLSVNSPAMNTRSRRLTIGGTSTAPSPSRKRAGALDNSSFNSSSFILRYEAKRSRKEAQQTSYSEPGPPTPAKNKSFHSNTSMNKSAISEIAVLDTTPILKSCSSPNVSNRSLRSRIVDTPLTLKRAIRNTWRKKKSYDMKGKGDENTSVVILDKGGRTPLKRLDKRRK